MEANKEATPQTSFSRFSRVVTSTAMAVRACSEPIWASFGLILVARRPFSLMAVLELQALRLEILDLGLEVSLSANIFEPASNLECLTPGVHMNGASLMSHSKQKVRCGKPTQCLRRFLHT